MGSSPARLLDTLFARLFPSRCIGCGLRGVVVCADCRSTIPWLPQAVCPLCAAPSRLARICPGCRDEPLRLDGARAACAFEGVTRKAVHDLKYRGLQDRAAFLAELLAQAIERRPLAVDLLVPIPLAPGRRRQRGFNQSELIGQHLAGRLSAPMMSAVLVRTRETPRQVGRTAAERRANIEGAFTCAMPEVVRGRRVAVVDDVMTTGATLGVAAEALRVAGASRVYGLAVAREI